MTRKSLTLVYSARSLRVPFSRYLKNYCTGYCGWINRVPTGVPLIYSLHSKSLVLQEPYFFFCSLKRSEFCPFLCSEPEYHIVHIIYSLLNMFLSSHKDDIFLCVLCVSFIFSLFLGNLALCCAFTNLRTDEWRNFKANCVTLLILSLCVSNSF
jgi:hypothetical protein